MPIELLRVDERLIHGQVVVGWGTVLHADRIVVVDDTLAASPWEQELYSLGVPPEMEASFHSVADAAARWGAWMEESARSIILVRDVGGLALLADAGLLEGMEVNLGGIHDAPEREKILNYLFLGEEEWAALEHVQASGAEVVARDLPGSRAVALSELRAGR